MQLIFEDKNRRVVSGEERLTFSSFSAFHLFVIKVRETKNFVLHIDNKETLNIKPARELQIIYAVTFLQGKDHTLSLEKKQKNRSLTLESFEVFVLDLDAVLTLEINNQAEDGDRRPWVTCLLNNLPLRSFTYTLTYSRRKHDSDDVKIVVDNTIQGSLLKTIKYKLWRLIGSFLPLFSPIKTETETITLNLPQQSHLIEFIADRMPVLNSLTLDLGAISIPPTRVPTVDDPAWTGDFYDDSEEIILARLLFGEAENQSREVKEWIAGSVLNRIASPAWPNTIHEVILQPGQYDPFKDTDINFSKITDPLNNASDERVRAWKESHEVAQGLLSGDIKNPSEATHFHGIGVTKEWFLENIVPKGRFIKTIDNTSFYWSPN